MSGDLMLTTAGSRRPALEADVVAAFTETAHMLTRKDREIALLVSANQRQEAELQEKVAPPTAAPAERAFRTRS